MEYIIIFLWTIGAMSEAINASYSNSTYGEGDFSLWDTFFVIIWPLANIVVVVLAFSQAFADGPWHNK